MGIFKSRYNSINQDSSCIEEGKNGTFYHPKDFKELLKKLKLFLNLKMKDYFIEK